MVGEVGGEKTTAILAAPGSAISHTGWWLITDWIPILEMEVGMPPDCLDGILHNPLSQGQKLSHQEGASINHRDTRHLREFGL